MQRARSTDTSSALHILQMIITNDTRISESSNGSHNVCLSACEVEKIKGSSIVTFFTKNLKRDPLEIQHPKFENSSLSLMVSVHER